MIKHLKTSEIASVRSQLLKAQKGKCAICGKPMTTRDKEVLDHDHDTGFIRGVLHASCNGIEGRMKALGHRSHKGVVSADYIIGLGKYLEAHRKPRLNAWHPSFKSPQQKRDAANAKARARRAAKKVGN